MLVNRNQNDNEVIYQVRQDNMVVDNNLAAMVERIMARNGLNVGLHRPSYSFPLSEYILQIDILQGGKSPNLLNSLGTLLNPLLNMWLDT